MNWSRTSATEEDRLDADLDLLLKGGKPDGPLGETAERVLRLASEGGLLSSRTRPAAVPRKPTTRVPLAFLNKRHWRIAMSLTSTAAIVAIVLAITFSTFQYLGSDSSDPSPSGSSLSAISASTPEASPEDYQLYPLERGTLEGCTVPAGDTRNLPFPLSDDVGTPEASTPVPGDTASPLSIVIEEAGVDARVEKRNIIDGVMEPPSGPADVAWYQQTDLLGEVGNVVLVGYADYWDIGPAVFANLYDLAEGDEIVATGTDGNTYVYAVASVDLYDVADLLDDTETLIVRPSSGEIIGPTREASITLITCGGEFDYDRSEYLSRVVVRGTLSSISGATPEPTR